MAVSMRDIAKRAGVSLKTVSRVVNQEAHVTSETRELVLEVIDKIGFVPHVSARRLSSGKSKLIGMIISYQDRALPQYSGFVLENIIDACNRHDYSVVPYKLNTVRNGKLVGLFKSQHVDGFVLDTPSSIDPDIIQQVTTNSIPIVVLQPNNPDLFSGIASTILLDDYAGSKTIVRHLIGLGHRRIGFVNGINGSSLIQERLAGYQDALAEAGINYRPEVVAMPSQANSFERGIAGAKQLLAADPDLTAIYANSDFTAIGVIQALASEKRRVPTDISVVGFDDLPIASMALPPLTTMRQPLPQMVEKAIELLLERIDKPLSKPQRVIFETELVIRESCCAL